MKQILFTLLLGFITVQLSAQNGVRGALYDDETGETIPFADILVQGTTTGTNTDLDGAYTLELEPGTYTLVASYLGFDDLVVNDVVVTSGEYNILDLRLGASSEQLAEVVVTAQQVRNNEAAVVSLKRNTASFLDGISSQTFRRTGDSDAASAIKRVPGISIEGGQYVFVRGLGDRYSKTLINGVDIPGLDPDRNAIQLDLFPTNLIDNILVFKTFTPDLPGDFSGGLVQVTTKDFPEQRILSASVGVGYNPQAHFKDDFIQEQGPGAADLLGTDNGHRELPYPDDQFIPRPSSGDQLLTDLTRGLQPNMAVEESTALPNTNISVTFGDQKALKKGRLGYTLTLNQRRERVFDPEAEFTFWEREQFDNSILELIPDQSRRGRRAQTTDQLSGLAGIALKYDRHKFSLSVMRSQQGVSTVGRQVQTGGEDNTVLAIFKDVVEYNDRNLTNVLLSGKHNLSADRLEVNWKVSPSFATSDDPDVRQVGFEENRVTGDLEINPSTGAVAERIWRNLDETSLTGRVDATYKLNLFNENKSKIKAGVYSNYKERDFSILNYRLEILGDQLDLNLNGDADRLLVPENVWTPESNFGTHLVGNREIANTYEADQTILAGYAMAELGITDRLRAIAGARLEQAEIRYTGTNNNQTQFYNDSVILDETNLLPSISLIYALTPTMNLRASYTSTVARPTFKEKSLAQIVDRLAGTTFIGNPNLQQSEITNYDLRWENLMTGGQSVSVSLFYKTLENPIEMVVFSQQAPDAFTPRNMGDGEIYGVEFEANRNLDFIGLPQFSIKGNLTLVESNVEMDSVEFTSKVSEQRVGETIDNERQMAFQPPFIINAALTYATPDRNWEANLNYNVQGERLVIVGLAQYPDIFERPFHSLNLRVARRINEKMRVSVGASNILDQKRVREYQSFGSQDRVFSRIAPGQVLSLGLNYRFI